MAGLCFVFRGLHFPTTLSSCCLLQMVSRICGSSVVLRHVQLWYSGTRWHPWIFYVLGLSPRWNYTAEILWIRVKSSRALWAIWCFMMGSVTVELTIQLRQLKLLCKSSVFTNIFFIFYYNGTNLQFSAMLSRCFYTGAVPIAGW